MKAILVLGSFCAIALLLFASCSSAVAYQTMQSNTKQTIQTFKNKIRTTLDSLVQSKSKTTIIPQHVQEFLAEKETYTNDQIVTLLNRCSAFHDAVDAVNVTPQRLLFVLAATIVTEFFVYLVSVKAPVGVLFLLSVIINGITNPAVNLVYYAVYNNVFVLESLVTIVESFMIYVLFNAASVSISLPNAIFLSLIANLASYIIASGLASIVFGSPTS